ncbi:hypothetical protein COO60DRAFT_1675176 [Scenedesmus sp. NREL 46B-D3]|nr:hypothetical protein COO60DRAFT_1675176 [Scenedesmus sp. NREL 46B-D3]
MQPGPSEAAVAQTGMLGPAYHASYHASYHAFDYAVALTHPYDLPEGVSADDLQAPCKSLCVMPFGHARKIYKMRYHAAHISENMEDAWSYLLNHFDAASGTQRTFHVYAVHEKQIMLDHNVPVAQQVQGMNNVAMYLLLQRVNGIPLAVKVDAWCFLRPEHTLPCMEEQAPLIDTSSMPALSADTRMDAYARDALSSWGKVRREREPFAFTAPHDGSVPELEPLPPAWRDHAEITDSAQVEAVAALGSALVVGDGGVGKTHLALAIARLDPGTFILAPTFKASNNLQGCTVHSFVGAQATTSTVGRRGLAKRMHAASRVLVDEVFMRPDLPFFLFGDPRQLLPVEPGVKPCDYMEHPALEKLARCNRVTLPPNYRCDPALKACADAAYAQPDFCLTDHFPPSWLPCALNIAHINVVCKHVNAVTLPADAPIMQQLRAKRDLQNNEFLTVVSVGDSDAGDGFTTRRRRDGEERWYALADFHDLFRVGYCFTIHKAQGDTLTEDFVIWEHESMDERHRYTSVTRAKRKEQIRLGQLPSGFGRKNMLRILQHLGVKLRAYRAQDHARGHEAGPGVGPVIMQQDSRQVIVAANEACGLCGRALKVKDYTRRDLQQATLDRIDNRLGHVPGNVRVACLKCNQAHAGEAEGQN